METSSCCNSTAGNQIATIFCTCHDSTAVVPCTIFCSDHCIRIEMRVKRNFHRIWIAMEKPLVKRGPAWWLLHVSYMQYESRRSHKHMKWLAPSVDICIYIHLFVGTWFRIDHLWISPDTHFDTHSGGQHDNHSAMTHRSKTDWHQLNGITHRLQQ